MEEKLYQLALELIPGIGDVNAKNLIAYCGSASAIFTSKVSHLKKIPGIGAEKIEALTSSEYLSKAEAILKDCGKKEINIYHYTDKDYPTKLKQVADAPNIIYAKGSINEWTRVLGIVGTRNATEYGQAVTTKIVEDCKSLNVVIVSGLAYGIDITAHRAALKNNIPTIGVLAGGLDKIYPALHKKNAQEMLEHGGLISENPPGTKPEAHFFPARNRIIAGMSDAIIVVEAAKKGGALITANIADSYNKTVFAVPGDLDNKYSEGCNFLIRNQKALLFTGVNDLRYHLNWDDDSQASQAAPDYSSLSEEDQKIVAALSENKAGVPIDELAWKTQITVNQLASNLLTLEFSGLVKSLPGKKYKLC
ncbi:MAG: DNA-protecting protein DprA [Rickettsiales bacterium]|nr:DNA-protecting protein DprA [Rickettsiales bacterium]